MNQKDISLVEMYQNALQAYKNAEDEYREGIKYLNDLRETLHEQQKKINNLEIELQEYKVKFEQSHNNNIQFADVLATISSLRSEMEDVSLMAQRGAELDSLRGTIDNAQNTANEAVSKANNAQATADAAQQTASSAVANSVKNIKFFTAIAQIDTRDPTSEAVVVFPERVDAVALESIINDGDDMRAGRIERINDTTFKVIFYTVRGSRWIPSLRFIGIQVQR